MTRRLYFFLFLTCINSYSQITIDSLNVYFATDIERDILTKLYSENTSENYFLEALLAIDTSYTERQIGTIKVKIDDFLMLLEKKASKYNEKKSVKYIFNQSHDQFFKKYEIDAYFPDIFNSATYNCVTATALYVYLFDYFKIPFQIKETPTHVFLVAYPHTHNIYVETTLPGVNGYYAPAEGMVKKAVNQLVKMKMITEEQVENSGYTKAYNDYYYGDENISKKELIGIQYYNKAIVHFNNENYKAAYQNISKARLFYKNKKASFFSNAMLKLFVEKVDFRKIENFKWFIELSDLDEDKDFLKYKLTKILTEDSWSDKEFNIVEEKLNTAIFDEELKSDFLQILYGIRADRYAKLQQHKKALYYAEKIYKLNPNHLTAKNYICISNIESLAQKNFTEERLNDLKYLTEKYPFVTDFGIYIKYKIYLYAFLTAQNFNKDNSAKGLQYLSVLEGMMNEQVDGVDFSQEVVGNAYGSVGAYYYRKQQKSKAVEYLKRGLKYSPDNENINRKLKLIKNSY